MTLPVSRTWNWRKIDKRWIWEDLKGSGRGLIHRKLHEGLRKIQEYSFRLQKILEHFFSGCRKVSKILPGSRKFLRIFSGSRKFSKMLSGYRKLWKILSGYRKLWIILSGYSKSWIFWQVMENSWKFVRDIVCHDWVTKKPVLNMSMTYYVMDCRGFDPRWAH
jgi:hypothetical protein